MSVAATVRRKARTRVEVIRRTGFYDKGRWRPTDGDPVPIMANVQPAPRDVVQRLPEGSRNKGAIVLFAIRDLRQLGDLRVAAAATPTSPEVLGDKLVVAGVEYVLEAVEPWASHRRYVATRHGQ